MPLFSIPFTRWPLRRHIIVAGALVALCAIGAVRSIKNETQKLAAREAEVSALVHQLQALKLSNPNLPRETFLQRLPAISISDQVISDMSRHAQSMNLQISSLTVSATEASATELRKVQYTVSASGEYRATKDWLAELLSRYPALGVQALSMRASTGVPSKQDVQLVMVLFVKD